MTDHRVIGERFLCVTIVASNLILIGFAVYLRFGLVS